MDTEDSEEAPERQGRPKESAPSSGGKSKARGGGKLGRSNKKSRLVKGRSIDGQGRLNGV